MTSFLSYRVHKIFSKLDFCLWPLCRWDSNSSEMFNRCMYGFIFKILNRLILKLLHSQIWVSTPLLCSSVPQGNNSTPSAFYNWGLKMYWVSSIFLGVHTKFKMIIYSNLQIINLLKKGMTGKAWHFLIIWRNDKLCSIYLIHLM